jgi:hypothetical protein
MYLEYRILRIKGFQPEVHALRSEGAKYQGERQIVQICTKNLFLQLISFLFSCEKKGWKLLPGVPGMVTFIGKNIEPIIF